MRFPSSTIETIRSSVSKSECRGTDSSSRIESTSDSTRSAVALATVNSSNSSFSGSSAANSRSDPGRFGSRSVTTDSTTRREGLIRNASSLPPAGSSSNTPATRAPNSADSDASIVT